MTMTTYTECDELLTIAINERMKRTQRQQTFQKLYSDYQQFFKMLINSEYVRKSSMTKYQDLCDDIKRIRHILRHSSDERLRAMAKAQQQKISKELKTLTNERKHTNYIVSIYREALPDKNNIAERHLRRLMKQIYSVDSISMSRFSSDTIDRITHESTKPRYSISSEMINVDDMS